MMTRITVLVARATACLGRLPRSRLLLIAIIGLVALGEVAIAAQSYRISQKGRAFNLKEITIALGDTVLFGNDDDFIHQIYVKSDSFNIDTAISATRSCIVMLNLAVSQSKHSFAPQLAAC